MAIANCSGYATEATRRLMTMAQQGEGYQILVWHDADPYGYNIARTLASETSRMPNHRVQVFDLGLKLEEALAMGLQTETFDRTEALASTVFPLLSETEYQFFEGRKIQIGPNKWIWKDCQRVEINAIPIKERVAYLDHQLAKIQGLLPKVKPPADELAKEANERLQEILEEWVRAEVEKRLNLNDIVADALKQIGTPLTFNEGGLSSSIDEQYQCCPAQSWRDVLEHHVKGKLDSVGIDIAATVTAAINTVVTKKDRS